MQSIIYYDLHRHRKISILIENSFIVSSSPFNNFCKYKWHHLEVITFSWCTHGVGSLKSHSHEVYLNFSPLDCYNLLIIGESVLAWFTPSESIRPRSLMVDWIISSICSLSFKVDFDEVSKLPLNINFDLKEKDHGK